jgi:hypothetical protein
MENGSCMMIFVKVKPHFLLVSNKDGKKISTLNLECLRFPPLLQTEKKALKVLKAFPQSFMLGILIKISEHKPVLIKSGTLRGELRG